MGLELKISTDYRAYDQYDPYKTKTSDDLFEFVCDHEISRIENICREIILKNNERQSSFFSFLEVHPSDVEEKKRYVVVIQPNGSQPSFCYQKDALVKDLVIKMGGDWIIHACLLPYEA